MIHYCNLRICINDNVSYLPFVNHLGCQLRLFSIDFFGPENAVKLTYVHLLFQKYSRGLYPELPLKRVGTQSGGEEEKWERKRGRK
jgi:hypothetical protein